MEIFNITRDLNGAPPIMNAPVMRCSPLEELISLDTCPWVCAVSTKTITRKSLGNQSPITYYYDSKLKTSINRVGLKSEGWSEYYKSGILGTNWKKPLIISADSETLPSIVNDCKYIFDGTKTILYECNLSCPNITTSLNSHISSSLQEHLESLLPKLPSQSKIGIKLPPIIPYDEIIKTSGVLNIFDEYISHITCCNTFRGAFNVDGEFFFGGVGGAALKPISLYNVFTFKNHLSTQIKIIASGGVFEWSDVKNYLHAGASIVQIGTHYQNDGKECFKKIFKEYLDNNSRNSLHSKL